MIEYLGFFGLAAIVVSLTVTYLKRRRREKAMLSFYEDHSLRLTADGPAAIRRHLGAAENLVCREGILHLPSGRQLPFFWWEWLTKTYRPAARGSSHQYEFFLAISFVPQTVDDISIQRIVESAGKNAAGADQKIKDFFAPNIRQPLRAEKLADGSLLIYWQMTKERKNYEAKLAWLSENVVPAPAPDELKHI